jgi:lipopolysaccharide/colanic/teichoic acid biosynthesis glycosyltransferase
VLLGNMSLVGPRPPVTYHPYDGFDGYQAWAKKRFEMKPGITGLSQITVRNSVNWDERIALDNKYVEQFNVWMDIKILVRTAICVLKRNNIIYMDKQQVTNVPTADTFKDSYEKKKDVSKL